MAKTAQEKLDAKREKAYYKKHKKMYRTKPGDVIFYSYMYFPILLSVYQHGIR